MGLAVVGDIGCGRGRIKRDIRLFDHKCLRTRYSVIAVRLVNDVDRGGIAGVYIVCVADFVFTCINSRTAVNDCNRGLFGIAVVSVADKGGPILVKQRDGRVLYRFGGNGDLHMTHIRIAVVGVALYLIIYRVLSRVGLDGNVRRIGPILSIHGVNHRAAGGRARRHKPHFLGEIDAPPPPPGR